MKIIVDMCLSPKWADELNAAGIDARHWSSLGAGNAPDSSLFEVARQDGAVILTADLDFGHPAGPNEVWEAQCPSTAVAPHSCRNGLAAHAASIATVSRRNRSGRPRDH